jgi:hypothetical protein
VFGIFDERNLKDQEPSIEAMMISESSNNGTFVYADFYL